MSQHKERDPFMDEGLRLHGMKVDTPSQLSDAFRAGVKYTLSHIAEMSAEMASLREEVTRLRRDERRLNWIEANAVDLKHWCIGDESGWDASIDLGKYETGPDIRAAIDRAVSITLSADEIEPSVPGVPASPSGSALQPAEPASASIPDAGINQCDGCLRRLPVNEWGHHRDENGPFGCIASKVRS